MDLMKMKEINHYFLACLLSLLLFSCHEKKPFSTERWFAKDDIFFTERKDVVEDLMTNYLKQGVCIEKIKDMLGEPVEISRRRLQNHIFYEIETKYGSDIDPDWIKYLEIKLDSDSCFIEAQVIKLN